MEKVIFSKSFRLEACNFTKNELCYRYFLRISFTLRNTYFKEHLTTAASETWLCKKELVIVFTEEFLSIKNLFLFTYWSSKNLKSIYISKYLGIRNSSLEIIKDFVYSPGNPEAATGGVLQEKLFLEISQNSRADTCARVSILIKLQT